jgi:hypothetical protein
LFFASKSKGNVVKNHNKSVHLTALVNQLEYLKNRTREPDAAHWRKIGKLAQDFTAWLERARPWISCASSLIALRVEQVIGEVDPRQPSEKNLRKISNLLEEASRQLANPGMPIQVLDLEREGLESLSAAESGAVSGGIALPSGLIEIPEFLCPEGNAPVQYRFLILN